MFAANRGSFGLQVWLTCISLSVVVLLIIFDLQLRPLGQTSPSRGCTRLSRLGNVGVPFEVSEVIGATSRVDMNKGSHEFDFQAVVTRIHIDICVGTVMNCVIYIVEQRTSIHCSPKSVEILSMLFKVRVTVHSIHCRFPSQV